MSKPPEDEDTFFQILEQIKQAITQSDVIEPEDAEIMEELEQGIRHSLEALIGMGATDEPKITVVEGGISDEKDAQESSSEAPSEAFSEKTKPKLTLLPSEDSSSEQKDDEPWDFSNVQVRVVSGESLFQQLGKSKKRSRKPPKGLIALRKGDSQVILRSEEKHLYRVICLQGKMKIQSHFEEDYLKEGQSLDVQTNFLVISAEEDSAGQYYCINL